MSTCAAMFCVHVCQGTAGLCRRSRIATRSASHAGTPGVSASGGTSARAVALPCQKRASAGGSAPAPCVSSTRSATGAPAATGRACAAAQPPAAAGQSSSRWLSTHTRSDEVPSVSAEKVSDCVKGEVSAPVRRALQCCGRPGGSVAVAGWLRAAARSGASTVLGKTSSVSVAALRRSAASRKGRLHIFGRRL